MALIFHTPSKNKNVNKALIAAEYVGVEIKMAENFQMGVSNKTPEFLKMNPIGKIPVLETPEGPIFESNAIARYVAHGSSLYGSSKIEYGQIEQWIDFSSFELDAHIRGWLYPRLGYGTYIKPAEESSIAGLKRGFDALNNYLASHTFLVGDCVTLADIITTCNLVLAFQHLTPKSFTSEYPHVERYFWTMINQPNFSKVFGEVKQADAVIPITSAKKPEAKKPEPKKEVKKEEAPKPEVKAAEEEEAPKPKPKNPSICYLRVRWFWMTGSDFTPTLSFWDMFDAEGYSLWFCDYKYNDENTVSFVTMNKVGGFLQRMDLARKYAFGKMLIIGNEPPFKVKGLWLFRGPEIPKFVMDECYDMELYEWTKVDLSDEAQKERVNQMIEDHEPFEGEALLDAKCFK
ncbi:putative elongation factor 1B gamma, glutathione S-transferase, Thioredoxin-like superfamily [Helianthus annuus]|nr:putative elongation factor 1B gamma, glutathione S-transferase, Thioredoxin-like superfamily [Helianthus annuus]